ncbi:MAG: DUF4258 domain-containing protein [Thiohalospira sp.]|uniref:DUF4258 domain-containing protein n=1 Tax=Thiohalorhabdus sp. TaxID=3094134 RepID=UPI00397F091F
MGQGRGSPEQLRKQIQEAAAHSERVRLTRHARERMEEREIMMREVLDVLRRGTFAEPPAPSLKAPGHLEARMEGSGQVQVVIGFAPDGDPIVLNVITAMRG